MHFSKLFTVFAISAAAPIFGQTVADEPSVMAVKPAAHQHAPIRIRERFDGSVTSSNWSGYAVTGANNSVSSVKGSWVVPSVVCGSPGPKTGYSSFWVGIDGYNSNSVEQTGTDSDCQNGRATYYAWYEFYPSPSFEITNFSVQPGDVITASVTYSGSQFTTQISNSRTGATFTKTKSVSGAKRSSAEWIAEAPSSFSGVLPLADFGTVFFGQDETGVSSTCYATIGSATGPIGSFSSSSVESITMETSNGTLEAVPSALSSDKTSFSVQWY